MIARLAILGTLAVLGVFAYAQFRYWQIRRAALIAPADPLLVIRRPNTPTILYFTTPVCVPCRTQQRPALLRLQSELGDGVQVIEVNAMEQTDAADRWGVMSIPTTFILDRNGTPRNVNYGVASVDKLRGQLQGL